MTQTENFIKQAKDKYGNLFSYDKFQYTNIRTTSIITCAKHGDFSVTPRAHMKTKFGGCKKCKKEKETELFKQNFISQAKSRYNNFFDYSKFEYVNAKTKGIIVCPKHGDFLQCPDKHLNGINPCPKCEIESKKARTKERFNNPEYVKQLAEAIRVSKNEFLEMSYKKYGKKFEFDLTNYSGIIGNNIRIKCPIHGWFEKQPHNFLVCSYGCSKCGMKHKNQSKIKSYDNFVEKANEIHNHKYTYPESNKKTYINRKSIVDIICPKHGLFKKKAQKHLSGQGCFQCKIEQLVTDGVLTGGYNTELFNSNKDIANKRGYIYYLKLCGGKYYKVGITVNLKNRIRTLKQAFGSAELLCSQQGALKELYNAEQLILSEFKQHRVYTKLSTELFNKDISTNKEFDKIFYKPNKNKVAP